MYTPTGDVLRAEDGVVQSDYPLARWNENASVAYICGTLNSLSKAREHQRKATRFNNYFLHNVLRSCHLLDMTLGLCASRPHMDESTSRPVRAKLTQTGEFTPRCGNVLPLVLQGRINTNHNHLFSTTEAFIFPHKVKTDNSFRRRCLVSWWWSEACAGDAGPGGAEGTWSLSPVEQHGTRGYDGVTAGPWLLDELTPFKDRSHTWLPRFNLLWE